MAVSTFIFCIVVIISFIGMMVVEYRKYQFRLNKMKAELERTNQAFSDHQASMQDDVAVDAQKELIYRYKRSELEQELQDE